MPIDAFAFMSLWLVSCSARIVLFAMLDMPGSLEGGLSPLGLAFSDWEGGRSMAVISSVQIEVTIASIQLHATRRSQ